MILLYQPYYHRKGHFSHFLNLYYSKIKANNWPCQAVLGIHDDIHGTLKQNLDFHLFNNRTVRRDKEILNNIKGFRIVADILEDSAVTAIHFLDMEPVLLALLCKRYSHLFTGKRIILHQHSVNHYYQPQTLPKKMYALAAKTAFRYMLQFDFKVTTNGPFISDFLQESGFVSEDTLITSSWGHQPVPNTNLEQKKTNTFLFPGIIRQDKNPEIMIDAFSRITEPCTLIIAGYPKDYTKNELHLMAKRLEDSPVEVEWHLGYLSDSKLDQLYRQSQFVVLPYHQSNKSSSGPLIAALQYQCIPIVSHYGERGRLVADHRLGYSFTFQDDNLSDVIVRALQDHQKNQQLLSNVQQIKHKYTWDHIIDELINKKNIYKTTY